MVLCHQSNFFVQIHFSILSEWEFRLSTHLVDPAHFPLNYLLIGVRINIMHVISYLRTCIFDSSTCMQVLFHVYVRMCICGTLCGQIKV